MSEQPRTDRRAHRRVNVQLWVDEVHDQVTYYQRSADISIGGMFLEGTIPHPKGTIVGLRFKFEAEAEAEPVTLRAEVVGEALADRLGMHLRFVDLDPESSLATALRAFIEDQAD